MSDGESGPLAERNAPSEGVETMDSVDASRAGTAEFAEPRYQDFFREPIASPSARFPLQQAHVREALKLLGIDTTTDKTITEIVLRPKELIVTRQVFDGRKIAMHHDGEQTASTVTITTTPIRG